MSGLRNWLGCISLKEHRNRYRSNSSFLSMQSAMYVNPTSLMLTQPNKASWCQLKKQFKLVWRRCNKTFGFMPLISHNSCGCSLSFTHLSVNWPFRFSAVMSRMPQWMKICWLWSITIRRIASTVWSGSWRTVPLSSPDWVPRWRSQVTLET